MVDPEPLDRELALASHWVAMADGMKPCKVCGKTVSPNAKTCPHCGEPEPNHYNLTLVFNLILLSALGILIIIILILYLNYR